MRKADRKPAKGARKTDQKTDSYAQYEAIGLIWQGKFPAGHVRALAKLPARPYADECMKS